MSSETLRPQMFDLLKQFEHKKIVFCQDSSIGLKAIIAVHDTTLGPAIGGVRMLPYKTELEAIDDVLRLSRAMTYKAAISGVNLGGGTAVIIGDHRTQKSEVILRRLGQFVEDLNGSFIASLDVGTTSKDMEFIHMETNHVVGLPKSMGGSGDTAPFTAKGVFLGIKAANKELYGTDSLAGRTVAVQGTGKVGEHLVSLLREENVKVYVSDIVEDRMIQVCNKYGAEAIAHNNLFDMDVDVYAPCALGGTVNTYTIERMRCKIIAGSANNQLANDVEHGVKLLEKGIIYAPDFLINAGGLISCYAEIAGYSLARSAALTEGIYEATRSVIQKSMNEKISTNLAALQLAQERIALIKKIKQN
ncbi:Glu/Leu/Phe/Val dehydrogenase [Olivibacter sp. SDN3]|uniref:Glu/Leu/Phe/Val family dehydrogenase n=1 Tax=Olivibacter sp. SDN3 TaxID=2764720 RepID=UPI00165144D1|nr:Glu/Leu/Phe/Val dehydrogenase [Olivibacter sp. SDN3]QNL49525.1 Glu/Leu/Phe/Val dehydrogenase [Olivibacter sp. SDN3]